MSGKMGNSPTNSISTLQEKALGLIGSKSDGLLQSELRCLLDINSSKCSKVVSRMQASGLIYREKIPASRNPLWLAGMLYKLTYLFNGRNMRLTDVYGELIPQIVA